MKKILILAASVFLAACNNTKQEEQAAAPSAGTVTEAAATPETENVDAVSAATNVANEPSFNGILVVPPQMQATVTVTMGGIVESTSVIVGQHVKKGEVVAVLDNPEFIELQQGYLDAAAQLEYLEKDYLRQQNLASHEASSQKKLQQSKADYLSVKSKAEAMAARLSLLGIDAGSLRSKGMMTRLEVKAPISGYVTDINVNVGKYLEPGEPVCDIIDKSRLMLQLTAYEKDLSHFRTGSIVEFRANGLGDRTFEAQIVSIDQKVDNNNRSVKVFAQLKGTDELFRPGMYVSARIKKN